MNNGIWEGDKLERWKDAEFLISYLANKYQQNSTSNEKGSFVLNINAQWGYGKTFFLNHLSEDLKARDFPVVVFNAWENDFSDDPFIAFISALESELTPFLKRSKTAKHYLKATYDVGKKLITPSVPFLLSVLSKKLTNYSKEELQELLNETEESDNTQNEQDEEDGDTDIVSTVIAKAAEQSLKKHNSRISCIKEFNTNLSKLINHIDRNLKLNLPLFVIIDEVDRCRPNYAIELLENIKHIFGIPGVFFIIATDSEQLCHSIKSIYGVNFDSARYLKRFFDQEYTFPDPDDHLFPNYLFEKYNLSSSSNFFCPLINDFCVDNDPNKEMFAIYSKFFKLSLRDQEQCCELISTIHITYNNQQLHSVYLFFLIMLRHLNNKLFSVVSESEPGQQRASTISRILKEMDTNENVKVSTIITKEDRRADREEKAVKNFIYEYIKYAERLSTDVSRDPMPDDNIFKMLRGNLILPLNNPYDPHNPPTHDFSVYPSIIKQAGHISS